MRLFLLRIFENLTIWGKEGDGVDEKKIVATGERCVLGGGGPSGPRDVGGGYFGVLSGTWLCGLDCAGALSAMSVSAPCGAIIVSMCFPIICRCASSNIFSSLGCLVF